MADGGCGVVVVVTGYIGSQHSRSGNSLAAARPPFSALRAANSSSGSRTLTDRGRSAALARPYPSSSVTRFGHASSVLSDAEAFAAAGRAVDVVVVVRCGGCTFGDITVHSVCASPASILCKTHLIRTRIFLDMYIFLYKKIFFILSY